MDAEKPKEKTHLQELRDLLELLRTSGVYYYSRTCGDSTLTLNMQPVPQIMGLPDSKDETKRQSTQEAALYDDPDLYGGVQPPSLRRNKQSKG